MELLRKTALLRVEEQTRGVPPAEVRAIALHDVPLPVERLLSFSQLTRLTLVSLRPRLRALDGVPLAALPALAVLDVSDNAIAVQAAPTPAPALRKLFIANNQIEEWVEIERLATAFSALTVLDITHNKADDPARFNDIFALFPALVALDSKNKDGEEVVVADTDESSSGSDDDDDESDASFITEDEEEEEENSGNGKGSAPPLKLPRTE
ncbi:hypothetical protein LSM04_005169 [Trypanosoma melophagium]|uniref:uncharacterized protein n=1 Tax=Trypanosoma melophagium TaxID=715481 RepID=UPI00351A5A86|nr:hypothetical protein LSM04_005169 [Trypanosoma melophagium]